MSFHFFSFIGNRSVANIIACALTPATIKHKIKDICKESKRRFSTNTQHVRFAQGKRTKLVYTWNKTTLNENEKPSSASLFLSTPVKKGGGGDITPKANSRWSGSPTDLFVHLRYLGCFFRGGKILLAVFAIGERRRARNTKRRFQIWIRRTEG